MGRRFVVTLLGALACGTKTGGDLPTHNPPAPEPTPTPLPEPPAPAPAPVPEIGGASATERVLNGTDPQGRLIYRAADGACFINLPPAPPPPGAPAVSFRPLPREAVDCPTSMKAVGWENCIAGRLIAPAPGSGTDGNCLCAVFGNPPPPPRVVACPAEEG